jgi:hypothetical protein
MYAPQQGSVEVNLQVCFCVVAITLTGCTLANYHSISRKFDTNDGKSRFLDAQQRSIIVWQEPSLRDCGLDRQDCANPKEPIRRPIVCAEPSPDALVAYAATLAAEGEYSGASAALNLSTIGAAAAIGRRTQSIQLLRDAYYRACEAYVSQAIDEETYDGLIRRLNNQSIAYLAIEQITSTFAATPDVRVAPPDLTPHYEKLATAKKSLEQAAANKKKADEDLAKNTDPTKAEALKAAANKAAADLETVTKAVDAANQAIIDAAKPLATGGASGGQPTALRDRAAEAIEKITLKILNEDFSAQMCYANLRLGEKTGDPYLKEYCKKVLEKHLAGVDEDIRLQKTTTNALQACLDKAHDAADLAKCAKDIPQHDGISISHPTLKGLAPP